MSGSYTYTISQKSRKTRIHRIPRQLHTTQKWIHIAGGKNIRNQLLHWKTWKQISIEDNFVIRRTQNGGNTIAIFERNYNVQMKIIQKKWSLLRIRLWSPNETKREYERILNTTSKPDTNTLSRCRVDVHWKYDLRKTSRSCLQRSANERWKRTQCCHRWQLKKKRSFRISYRLKECRKTPDVFTRRLCFGVVMLWYIIVGERFL